MDKNTRFLLVAGGMVLVLGVLLRNQARAAIQAAASFNEGTIFEDTGIVGALGNVADQASAGVLSDIGSAIGLFGSKTINFFRTGGIRTGEFK